LFSKAQIPPQALRSDVGLSTFDEMNIYNEGKEITPSNYHDFFVIASNTTRAFRIDQLLAASTDTVDHVVYLYFNNAYSDRVLLGTFVLPAGSATTAILPPIDVLPKILATLLFLQVDISDTIQISIPVAISTDETLWFQSIGGFL
jgi:hypothetical protein